MSIKIKCIISYVCAIGIMVLFSSCGSEKKDIEELAQIEEIEEATGETNNFSTDEIIDKPTTSETNNDENSNESTETDVKSTIIDLKDFEYEFVPQTAWQEAYLTFLNEIRVKDEAYYYQLYDIDKDETPELIITTQNYDIILYTYVNEELSEVGSFLDKHLALYTWPHENAMMLHWGHQGSAEAIKISIDNGAILWTRYFSENVEYNPDKEYTPISKILPGSVRLDEYSIESNLPLEEYYNNSNNSLQKITATQTEINNQKVKEFLWDTIQNNEMIYAIDFDSSFNSSNPRYIYFSELCDDEKSETIDKYAWADLNEDGQSECVLHTSNYKWIVMSYQEDVVYAYKLDLYSENELLENGMIYCEYYEQNGWAARFIFNKNELFEHYILSDIAASKVEWKPFVETTVTEENSKSNSSFKQIQYPEEPYVLQARIGEFFCDVHMIEEPGEDEASPEITGYGYPEWYSPCSSWCACLYFERIVSASSELLSNDGRYSADNVISDYCDTAWAEGVEGRGIGESISYSQACLYPDIEWDNLQKNEYPDIDGFMRYTEICIVNGYAKTQQTWEENGRVKTLLMYIEDKPFAYLQLEDTILPQYFALPEESIIVPNGATLEARYEIIDVYPGTLYDDTCLTGIVMEFTGRYGH